MLRLLVLGGLLPLTLAAGEHWIRFQSGASEVYTSGGAKEGRETLVKYEEFRHALGEVLGESDLQLPLPLRILVFKTGAPRTPAPVVRGRAQYDVVLTSGRPIPNEVFAGLTRLYLDTTSARMPERIERGLVALFSTIQVSGIKITLGEPPLHPDMDWARVHLLAVDEEYAGKLRVLTYNLRRGVDEGAAFRNAFGKPPEEIERQAELHLASGRFGVTSLSPLAMSPEDFPERPVTAAGAQLAIADLLLGEASRAAYRELIGEKEHVAEAWEGLGMLALGERHNDEARQDFASALEAGAKSPESYVEYARVEPDNAKAAAALERALQLNPKLAEAHYLLAGREADGAKRIKELEQAAKLDPRNLGYWEALGGACVEAHEFTRAAQAWTSGEQAATTPGDRARLHRLRLEVDQERLDWEAAENRRKADEQAREIERLKQQARADLHAMEARANQGQAAPAPGEKVAPWWDGPQPTGSATGVLKQVDCLGKRLRLVVQEDGGKTVKLLVKDPAQVAVMGGEVPLSLRCGAQKAQRVKVGYFPSANARLATRGDVASIEFR